MRFVFFLLLTIGIAVASQPVKLVPGPGEIYVADTHPPRMIRPECLVTLGDPIPAPKPVFTAAHARERYESLQTGPPIVQNVFDAIIAKIEQLDDTTAAASTCIFFETVKRCGEPTLDMDGGTCKYANEDVKLLHQSRGLDQLKTQLEARGFYLKYHSHLFPFSYSYKTVDYTYGGPCWHLTANPGLEICW